MRSGIIRLLLLTGVVVVALTTAATLVPGELLPWFLRRPGVGAEEAGQARWVALGLQVAIVAVVVVGLFVLARYSVLVPYHNLRAVLSRLSKDDRERVSVHDWDIRDPELAGVLAVLGRRVEESRQRSESIQRLQEQLGRRDRLGQIIHDMIKQVTSTLSNVELRAVTLRLLRQVIQAEYAIFVWVDSRRQEVVLDRLSDTAGEERSMEHALEALPADRDELQRALRGWGPWDWLALRLENPAWQVLHADLTVAERFVGVVAALRSGDWHFSDDEDGMFAILVENLGVALENARLYDLAIRDELTSLFTRRYFEQRIGGELERCRRQEQALSLVMMDLNNFKLVNDQLGHAAGDQLLSDVGRMMAKSIRTFDLPARYGGDEFLVVLPNTSVEQARGVAQRIRSNFEKVKRPLLSGPRQVGLSVGIATFPEEATNVGDLLSLADNRMYEEKRAAKVA